MEPEELYQRSSYFMGKKLWGKALEGAKLSLDTYPSFIKTYDLLIPLLSHLGRLEEATEVLNQGFLVTEGSERAVLRQLLEGIQRQEKHQSLYADSLSKNANGIRVAYLGRSRGLGMIAVRDIKQGEIMLKDTPVVSSSKYPLFPRGLYYRGCDHCYRCLDIPKKNLVNPIGIQIFILLDVQWN